MWLKQSTAVTIRLGPALDKTDGVTEETALSPTVEVSKNHAAFGARNSASAITHDSNGWYAVPLDTTDTGTLGPLIVKFDSAADHLPVWREFLVVPAHVYDGLVAGTDNLQVDTVQWLGTACATPTVAGVPEVDPTHWNGTAVATPDTVGYPKVTIKDGTGTGEINTNAGAVAVVDLVTTLTTYTGNTPQTGDAFARLGAPAGASTAADIAGVQSDTNDIQTRIPAALTGAGNMKADALAVNGSTNAAARLALSAAQMIPGTVDNTAHTPTTTEFEADDITEATADHYNGRLVLWTSGALVGQVTDVSDYVLTGGRGHFTVTAMTEAPANNDTFLLV